jgi:hypothetical protein
VHICLHGFCFVFDTKYTKYLLSFKIFFLVVLAFNSRSILPLEPHLTSKKRPFKGHLSILLLSEGEVLSLKAGNVTY